MHILFGIEKYLPGATGVMKQEGVPNPKALYLVVLRLQFKEDTPERPPVNRHTITFPPMGWNLLIPQYFWSHVWWGTLEFDRIHLFLTEGLASGVQVREPKVDNSDVFAGVDKDVLRFDITMDYSHFVQ